MNTPASLPSFQSRVVPVVVVTDPAQAVPMAEALLAGGVDVIEITLRSAAGLAAIEAVAKAVPAMQVGAGTVTRASEVAQVLNAGARFALSPGSTPALWILWERRKPRAVSNLYRLRRLPGLTAGAVPERQGLKAAARSSRWW